VHCLEGSGDTCDSRSFWLSAYSEREVLVESWRFAPRMVASPTLVVPFWDQPLLALNDAAFTAPTAEVLGRLRDVHHVRWLVADRRVGTVSPLLGTLATPRYDNARIAVFGASRVPLPERPSRRHLRSVDRLDGCCSPDRRAHS
jgi:hypothetical protein